jgi:hypothetical protein
MVPTLAVGTWACSNSGMSFNDGAGGTSGAGGMTGAGGSGTVVTCRNYTSTKTAAPLWQHLSPSGSIPQIRYGTSSAFDATHDTMIVFGGTDKSTSYNDVRLLSNASGSGGTPAWTTRQTSGTPPSARSFALAAYNAAQDSFFVFGGVDGNNQIKMDLWKLSNASGAGGASTWSNVSMSGSAPSPVRCQMSAMYDSANDALIFFGGISCNPTLCTSFNDTYALKGLGTQPTWSPVSTAGGSPPGRFFHSTVYDAANDRMVIFGGNAATNPNGDATANLDDVWILSGAASGAASWRQLVSGQGPGAMMGHSALYDSVNDRMIVYGGVNTQNYVTTDTWILADLSKPSGYWRAYETGTPTPPSRTLHAAGYTGQTANKMIVFGGSLGGGTYANDTWVLQNANARPTAPVARIVLSSTSTTVCTSNWLELTATADDANGNEVSGVLFQWHSSDESVATVDADGRVTAVATGTVTITAADETGKVTAHITITVTASTTPVVPTKDAGTPDCTCYCGWPADMVCHTNTDCPADTSVPGTYVPGACGCPIGCSGGK